MVEGSQAGLQTLDRIKSLPTMKKYFLLPATYAELHAQIGDGGKAYEYYNSALELVGTEPERRFLLRKVEACKAARASLATEFFAE